MKPNAIIVNEQVVATNLTPKEQDIYGWGELAGEAKYRDALKAKVDALPHDPRCHTTLISADGYTMCSCWKRDVMRLLNGGSE